jgi:outer membrane lipopolysaccharide assembly protein LptE/RlpB
MGLSSHLCLSYDKAVVRKLISLVCLAASGCGYHLANSQLNEGAGSTIAVPTFINRTTTYRIEQRLAEEVRRELIRRTRFKVVSDNAGDLLMSGEVLGYNAVPVIFNQQGRGSAYTMLVDLSVHVTDTRTGKVLFQNDRWSFREVFELSQSSSEFVPEDTAALDRLARHFASSLVASLLHSK